MKTKRRLAQHALLAALMSFPAASHAEQVPVTSPEEFIRLLEAMKAATKKPRLVVIQGVSTATTMSSGTVFASVSGTTKRDGKKGVDGSFAFGAGFGDPNESVGAQIITSITSANPKDLGDSGSFGVKLSRALPQTLGGGAVGITVENLAPWGDVKAANVKTSVAWTLGKAIPTGGGDDLSVLFNVGMASETKYHKEWTPFAAVGFGISESTSMTVAHNGDYAILGLTTQAPWSTNMSLSASLLDVFNQRDERRVTLTASYTFNDLF